MLLIRNGKTAHIKKSLSIVFIHARVELLLSLLHRRQIGGLFLVLISSDLSWQWLSIWTVVTLIEIHAGHCFIWLLSWLVLVVYHDVSPISLTFKLLVVIWKIQLI
jgi:hypothetical protein